MAASPLSKARTTFFIRTSLFLKAPQQSLFRAMELEEAFLWPNLLAHYLVRHIGAQALRDSALCSARRASSFFSGLGTSELAWFVVGLALLRFGLEASLACISACESSACCRGGVAPAHRRLRFRRHHGLHCHVGFGPI